MTAPSLIVQIFSLIGAFLCLIAYVGHQFRWMDANGIMYNLLNIIGAGILAFLAFRPFQAGFFLMETVWFLVSVIAIWKVSKSNK